MIQTTKQTKAPSEKMKSGRMKIEVFSSPGCSKCGEARKLLQTLIQKKNIEWREINILEEIDYAVSLGVLSAPAIAINGVLEFTGLPAKRQLLNRIEKKMQELECGPD